MIRSVTGWVNKGIITSSIINVPKQITMLTTSSKTGSKNSKVFQINIYFTCTVIASIFF